MDDFLQLPEPDRKRALTVAATASRRPARLLEKDVWMVWCLRALFESPIAGDLVFKGGTSLSEVYNVIHRFSEDVDLTYNIHYLARFDAAGIAAVAIADEALATAVADHEDMFFPKKDAAQRPVSYHAAVQVGIRLVPETEARLHWRRTTKTCRSRAC